MPRRYGKPAIAEAVCEFRLPASTAWDPAVPGILYERVKARYPARRPRTMPASATHVDQSGVQVEVGFRPGIQLVSEDGLDLLQVSERLMSVNRLHPYCGWPSFRSMIAAALDDLVMALDTTAVFERIGLRYINRFDLAALGGEEIDLDDYFDFTPRLGTALPSRMEGFYMGVELSSGDDDSRCRIVLTPSPSQSDSRGAIMLDLDFYPAGPVALGVEDALQYVERCHSQVAELFEGCITDRLRERLEPEVG